MQFFFFKSFSDKKEKWVPVTDITITTNRSGKPNKSGKGSDSKNWREDTVAKGTQQILYIECALKSSKKVQKNREITLHEKKSAHSWARKFKKVQAKKLVKSNKSISRIIF